ncbi:EAL domain-containing protein [Persephonella sp.]
MSLRKKFVVVLGFVFVLSLLLTATFYNRIIIGYFKETELLFIKREFLNFTKNLDNILEYLHNVAGNEAEYLSTEKSPSNHPDHQKLKLDFFLVFDKSGRLVFKECYLKEILCRKLILAIEKSRNNPTTGFLLIDNNLIGIALEKFDSGTVAVGQRFSESYVSGYASIEGYGRINTPSYPVMDVKNGRYFLSLYDTDSGFYRFQFSLADITGNIVSGFYGKVEKMLWNRGHITFHMFQFILTVLFVGILSFIFFSIDRFVARPIRELIGKIKNISKEKDLKTVYESIKDDYGSLELNQLSQEIKNMILRIESLLQANSEKTQLFQIIAENAPIGIYLYTEKFEYVNPAIEKISGYSKKELIGKEISFMMSHLDENLKEEITRNVKKRLNGEFFKNEFQTKIRTKDGQIKDILVISNTVKLFNKYYGLGIVLDITEIKNLERKLNELLDKDTLTGLLSRYGFTRQVDELIKILAGKKERYFLLIVDISRFKVINDSYGHQIGDRILKVIGERLKNSLHQGDLIGRLAADEFGIFISKYARFDDIAIIVDKIISLIEQPVEIDDYSFNLTCSIGVSVYPDDGESIDDLLKRADIALVRAKENFSETQKSSVVFFSRDLENKIKERLNLERELRNVLKNRPEEFYVEYQPIYNLQNMKIEKLEALVRWNSSKFGKLSPFKFIQIAEETGLIKNITDIVFERVIYDLLSWREKGIDIKVSINISPAEFKDNDFIDRVISRFKPHNLERKISLEITENVLLEDVEKAREKIKQLKQLGIDILLDDFGTGYSSLTYLKKFPISILKVDREFVKELPENGDDRGIVITIIQLSQLLSMDAVAEGIENQLQVNFLREIGCKYGQGYFFSRPVPAEEVEKLLTADLN